MRRLLAAALAALSLCGCGGLVTAQIDQPNLCATAKDMLFPAAPAGGTISRIVPLQLGISMVQQGNATATVHLTRAEVALVSGVADLTTIEALAIRVLPPPGSSLPARQVLSWSRDPAAGATSSLVAAGDPAVDLAPYLRSGGLQLQASVTGAPTASWLADVTSCFSITASASYGP